MKGSQAQKISKDSTNPAVPSQSNGGAKQKKSNNGGKKAAVKP